MKTGTVQSSTRKFEFDAPSTCRDCGGVPALRTKRGGSAKAGHGSRAGSERDVSQSAWQTVLSGLMYLDTQTSRGIRTSHALQKILGKHTWCFQRRSVVFSCIEREAGGALLVSWHDATVGNYSDQRWTRQISRACGTCALTGAEIARGVAVFKPLSRSAKNAGAMILEASVSEYPRAAD